MADLERTVVMAKPMRNSNNSNNNNNNRDQEEGIPER